MAEPTVESPGGDLASADRPATYGEVFEVSEYRAVFAAAGLSWIGDYFAKVAITVLIFHDTGSVLLSAAGFAASYLPWVAGGPVLAALAERYPYRRVMVTCDVVRALLVAMMALPGLPLPVLLLLMLTSSLLTPPFEAARSALVSQLLTGDRYVVGVSLQNVILQTAQVAGYAVGGVLTALDAHGALLINAATFGASALLLWCGVRPRPRATSSAHRRSLLKDTGEGVRLVFGHPVMRPIAVLVFCVVATVVVPEGPGRRLVGRGRWRVADHRPADGGDTDRQYRRRCYRPADPARAAPDADQADAPGLSSAAGPGPGRAAVGRGVRPDGRRRRGQHRDPAAERSVR